MTHNFTMASMSLSGRRCDHKWCPRRATYFVRDLEEIEPIITPYLDGVRVASTKPVGEVRAGCSWHPPESSKYEALAPEGE